MKRMLTLSLALCLAAGFAFAAPVQREVEFRNGIRPPATPLITVDPYFSLWSFDDELTADATRHWTGWKQPLIGVVRVDGKPYRIIGKENPDTSFVEGNQGYKHKPRHDQDEFYDAPEPCVFPLAAKQLSSNVLPTRSQYTFRCGGVLVDLTFTAPLLLEDIELLTRPVNYLSWSVRSADGRRHRTELYLEASPRFAIDLNVVPVSAEAGEKDGVCYLRTGTVEQPVLQKRGDDLRIDWGWFYLGAAQGELMLSRRAEARSQFAAIGSVASNLGSNVASDNFVTDDLALVYCADLGKVGREAVENHVMLGYDDVYSIRYRRKYDLRPWWNRDGSSSLPDQFVLAEEQYAQVIDACRAFDSQLTRDAIRSGGSKYADLCALAYRQAVSAHKMVASPDGSRMFFMSKENFSNGCCGTVDVTYPSMPLFLLYNNAVAQALIDFIFDYVDNAPEWKYRTWAPHDVGVYPDAYGQHYGNHMPLEESANMLLLTAAVVRNGAGNEYALRNWSSLTKWALFCVQQGQMPENQLCTDDFAGKLAHNVNLSAKSILGVAAYARMAHDLGKDAEADAFATKALEMAKKWRTAAEEGDHYRLAFDLEGSWSLKYNLVWDKLMGYDLFTEVIDKELDHYQTRFDAYGIPLDCRKAYAKTDWELWTAAMARSQEEFLSYVTPVWAFYNDTPVRVPMCDWVNTDEPTIMDMYARSVVGGFFMKMLLDRW